MKKHKEQREKMLLIKKAKQSLTCTFCKKATSQGRNTKS